MVDKNYRHFILIVDRSASMTFREEETVGGINNFVRELRKSPTKTSISLTIFDDHIDKVLDFVDLIDVKDFVVDDFKPRGMTALYDAVATTCINEGAVLASVSEDKRPGRVAVVVVTDGAENSSKEFTYDSLQKMIKHQKNKYNWEFIFLADGLDVARNYAGLGAVTFNAHMDSNDYRQVAYLYNKTTDASGMSKGMSASYVLVDSGENEENNSSPESEDLCIDE